MRSRSRYLVLVAVGLVALLAACGDENTPIPPPSQAEGLITEIRPPEGEPDSFLIESGSDGTFEVFLSDDVDYGFDLQHLHVHLNEGLPVRVELEQRDGKTYALQIEDA